MVNTICEVEDIQQMLQTAFDFLDSLIIGAPIFITRHDIVLESCCIHLIDALIAGKAGAGFCTELLIKSRSF